MDALLAFADMLEASGKELAFVAGSKVARSPAIHIPEDLILQGVQCWATVPRSVVPCPAVGCYLRMFVGHG